IFLELDLANTESIKVFVSRLLTKFKRVDVLINNAGVYYPPQDPPVTTIEGVEIHFAVNHLGHFLLTHLLTDTLVSTPQSRIVVVSSELYKSGHVDVDNLMGAGGGNKSSRQPLYNNSKLANLLHARELHNRLKSRGVLVCALSPGFVYSGLFRHSLQRFSWLRKLAFLPVAFFFMRSTVQGAQTSIHCACSSKVTLDRSKLGAPYFSNCQEKPLLPVALDDEAAKKLWEGSMRMLRLELKKSKTILSSLRGTNVIKHLLQDSTKQPSSLKSQRYAKEGELTRSSHCSWVGCRLAMDSVSQSGPCRPPGGVEKMQGGGRRVRLEWGANITV
ncbi:Short-chain dehydrogenase/reductase SDR, partial [Trinorchestia longiramus]